MKILFVCDGNTCRSPIAEFLLKDKLEKANITSVEVASCGINVLSNEQMSPLAVKALASKDINDCTHNAAVITDDAVNNADYIFTMSYRQKNIVSNYYRTQKARCIGELTQSEEIEDPYGKDYEAYESALNKLDVATDYIMNNIIRNN